MQASNFEPAQELLVDLDLFRQAQVVGHLDHDDAIEDRLVGVIGLELLPLGLVGVRHDAGVDVDRAVAAGRRHELLLGRRDHGVEVFGLVLEHLDELDHAAVADVERAVQLEHARIALGEAIELGDVLRADQHRGVLVVRVDRRHHADAAAAALGERHGADRHLLVAPAELLHQAIAADRAQVALDLGAQHLLERRPQMAGDQMERLLVDRAVVDHVDRRQVFEAALEALDQRALAGAHRAHQVEHLAALLAAHRGGVEVAHDLVERALHAEELVLEEVVGLDRLVAEQPLHPRVALRVDLGETGRVDHVVKAAMRQVRQRRILLHLVQILDERALPVLLLAAFPVLLDQLGEIDRLLSHAPHLVGWIAGSRCRIDAPRSLTTASDLAWIHRLADRPRGATGGVTPITHPGLASTRASDTHTAGGLTICLTGRSLRSSGERPFTLSPSVKQGTRHARRRAAGCGPLP